MFLRAQALGKVTTVPKQSVEEPRSESETPVLCKRRESVGRLVMMGLNDQNSPIAPASEDEARKERGKTKESGPGTVCPFYCQFSFINSHCLLGQPGLTPGI